MTEEETKKNKHHEWLIGIVVVLLVLIVIVVLFFGPGFPEKEEPLNVEQKQEIIDEEQIKQDIITGKIDDVPEEMNTTKRVIIRDYLYECHLIENVDEKIDCYELYYSNNDEKIILKKNECEKYVDEQKATCEDEYYTILAFHNGKIFCEGVQDLNNKELCLKNTE